MTRAACQDSYHHRLPPSAFIMCSLCVISHLIFITKYAAFNLLNHRGQSIEAVTNILSAEKKTSQSTAVSTAKVMTKMCNEYEDKWHMDPIPRRNIPTLYVKAVSLFQILIKPQSDCSWLICNYNVYPVYIFVVGYRKTEYFCCVLYNESYFFKIYDHFKLCTSVHILKGWRKLHT